MTEDDFRELLLHGTRQQLVSLAARLERWSLELRRHLARRWPERGLQVHNAEIDLASMPEEQRAQHLQRLIGQAAPRDDDPPR